MLQGVPFQHHWSENTTSMTKKDYEMDEQTSVLVGSAPLV